MKKLLLALAFLLPCSAFATTTVSGKMQDLGTGNITSGSFMRFWLRGCAGNQPRVNGTSVIGPTQGGVFYFDIAADSGGNISGTLYSTRDSAGTGNGEIECGGSKLAVWYGLQAFVSGRGGPEVPVHAKSGTTLDITQVTPITTNPVVPSPTGDTSYLRLDAGNSPIIGNVGITGSLTVGGVNGILYVDGVKYTTLATAIAALTSFGELALPPGTFTVNNSAGPLLISQANVYIHGSGRNITTIQCTTTTQDCLKFTGAKPRISGFNVAYSSQATGGVYALRFSNGGGQLRADSVYLETNINHGILIEAPTAATSSNDNEISNSIVGACTGNGITLTGSAANQLVLGTVLDNVQVLSCSGGAPSNGVLIKDWVQGTFINLVQFEFTDRPLFINPTTTGRTFDTFVQYAVFDATNTAGSPQEDVRFINTNDLRIINSWFGQAGTGKYMIYEDTGTTRNEINTNYFGDQNVIQPGWVYLSGTTTIFRNNHLISSTAPTTAAVVIPGTGSFMDVESNTFEGFAANKWINDSGTSDRLGPNYGDQASTANAAVGGPLSILGSTSGTVTISVPAVAGSNTFTLPALSGTAALSNTAQTWSGNQTNMPLVTPTITGVANGTGLQLFNSTTTCTTGASIGATCTTGAITLPVAYADTNYRLSCTGLAPTNVPVVETYTKSNTTFTITIAALTAAAATFTSYDCSSTHN